MNSEDLRTDLLDADEQLAFLARVPPCLRPRQRSHLATVQAAIPVLYVSQRVTRIVLVIQSPPSVKTHIDLGLP